MKKIATVIACMLTCSGIFADNLPIKNIHVAGPYTANASLLTDSTDVNGKSFDQNATLRDGISPKLLKNSTQTMQSDSLFVFPGNEGKTTVHLAGFTFENTHYANCNIKVTGKQEHHIYIDGNQGGDHNLMPGRHEVVVKIICKPGENDTISLSLDSRQSEWISVNPDGKRLYTLYDYMNGEKASSTSLSADGRFLLLNA